MAYRWQAAANHVPGPVMREPTGWTRVSRARRCPVCGKPDWCVIGNGGDVVCCMRVSEGAIARRELSHGTAYIHRLSNANRPPASCSYTPPARKLAQLDYDAILTRWRAHTPPEALDDLAEELGVSPESLKRLDAMFCPERGVWAFPMHNDRREVIGVRFRARDGAKFALTGSTAGAFIPTRLDSRSPIMVCEGPTDTAAALTLGYHALGRPSCSGATAIICDVLIAGRPRDVIIVADADGPGRGGAVRLGARILGLCRTVRIITAAPHKDLRTWLRAGATAELVNVRISQANYLWPAKHRTGE